MCGIAGYFSKKQVGDLQINKTLNLMRNRGPDNQDFQLFRTSREVSYVGLLHSRLSIIDLDPRSNQPFTIGTQTIVFNGEIYNYVELRDALHKKGIDLNTTSDTEVLLHYFLLHDSTPSISFFHDDKRQF